MSSRRPIFSSSRRTKTHKPITPTLTRTEKSILYRTKNDTLFDKFQQTEDIYNHLKISSSRHKVNSKSSQSHKDMYKNYLFKSIFSQEPNNFDIDILNNMKILSYSNDSASNSDVLFFPYNNKNYIMKITGIKHLSQTQKRDIFEILKSSSDKFDKYNEIYNIYFSHVITEYKIYKYINKFISQSINPFVMTSYKNMEIKLPLPEISSIIPDTPNIRAYNYSFANEKYIQINETNNYGRLISLSKFLKELSKFLKNGNSVYSYPNNKENIYKVFNIIMTIIVFQLLYCLMCFEKIKLKHNDLHLGNILVILDEKNILESQAIYENITELKVNLFNIHKKKYIIPNIGIEIRIFDFDRSLIENYNTLYYENKNLNLHNNESYKLYDKYLFTNDKKYLNKNYIELIKDYTQNKTIDIKCVNGSNISYENITDIFKVFYYLMITVNNITDDQTIMEKISNIKRLIKNIIISLFKYDKINDINYEINNVYDLHLVMFDISNVDILNFVGEIKTNIKDNNDIGVTKLNNDIGKRSRSIRLKTFNDIIDKFTVKNNNIDFNTKFYYNYNIYITLASIMAFTIFKNSIRQKRNSSKKRDISIWFDFDKYNVSKELGLEEKYMLFQRQIRKINKIDTLFLKIKITDDTNTNVETYIVDKQIDISKYYKRYDINNDILFNSIKEMINEILIQIYTLFEDTNNTTLFKYKDFIDKVKINYKLYLLEFYIYDKKIIRGKLDNVFKQNTKFLCNDSYMIAGKKYAYVFNNLINSDNFTSTEEVFKNNVPDIINRLSENLSDENKKKLQNIPKYLKEKRKSKRQTKQILRKTRTSRRTLLNKTKNLFTRSVNMEQVENLHNYFNFDKLEDAMLSRSTNIHNKIKQYTKSRKNRNQTIQGTSTLTIRQNPQTSTA